ncbi:MULTISPECIES: flagellar biosynthetic protein FliO [unclassified Herbaspirillum]|jgi:flagellar protein FliO/FliZ|uniref:flagellar biosynthetic protein FliO n=1 Tax=unclassified Herbaspirillum TaxID=2624150 RepID=UPI0012F6DC81|nr:MULTISPECIES: flagellar biosynthetic protein FliO [unclassified Herbaspirillum]MCI1004801.1 flagellar biosynthetic protein FliO [Herbaspirillum sp. C7C8]NUT59661.1 flagellar biosynthetic protein FliO [Herbaspirillum sp. C9C3]
MRQALRQSRADLVSALIFLGGSLAVTAQSRADNTTAGSVAVPAPAAAGALPSSTGSVLTMLLGLVAVLAVMAAVAWLFKRFGLASGMSGNAVAKVVGGVSVGTRERVMVVEVGDQWIVVGVAPGRVNALATLPRQEGVAAQPVTAGPAFATWLKHTMDKRNGGTGNGDRPGNDGSTS